jgi:hypothetical protein
MTRGVLPGIAARFKTSLRLGFRLSTWHAFSSSRY